MKTTQQNFMMKYEIEMRKLWLFKLFGTAMHNLMQDAKYTRNQHQ